jgi:hypothetical protein
MGIPTTRSHTIREVTRGLAEARDKQILQVVAMVDAMPNRGQADQLIAPLRSKLARLRPPRPLRFARLLFMPLDPLIVPASRWKPGQATIPRTVIPLLAEAVEQALGSLAPAITAMIEGQTTQNQSVVEAAGALLWPRAAELLPVTPMPAAWITTGLPMQHYQPMARRIAALLSQAERLQRLISEAGMGLAPGATIVRSMLADVDGRDPEAQPMVIALLLARVPDAGPALAQIATSLGPRGEASFRLAGEQAADVLLDQLASAGGGGRQLDGHDLAQAGETVRRLTSLLGALGGDSDSFARRERLRDLRERINTGCQALFTDRLSADLLNPLRACGADSGAEPDWELEAAARGLRALETEARRAGGGKTYDALMGQAADVVREVTTKGGLGYAGGLRLMEILAGAEVALALFGEEV